MQLLTWIVSTSTLLKFMKQVPLWHIQDVRKEINSVASKNESWNCMILDMTTCGEEEGNATDMLREMF
jgi:hypothetical protein